MLYLSHNTTPLSTMSVRSLDARKEATQVFQMGCCACCWKPLPLINPTPPHILNLRQVSGLSSASVIFLLEEKYRNGPKYCNKTGLANYVDRDQTASNTQSGLGFQSLTHLS